MACPPPRSKLQEANVVHPPNAVFSRLGAHASAIKDHSSRHGLVHTAKWLAGKTVFSSWSAIVFSADSGMARQPCAWPGEYRYVPPVRVSDLSPLHLNQLEVSGFQSLAAQLVANDEIYWVAQDEAMVSVGAVLHQSPQRFVLGLPSEALLIGHCETVPLHRNKGLYARAINDTVLALRRRGLGSVFMETRPTNEPSQKGILRAGLNREREVQAHIFFRSVVVRRDGIEWIKRS